MDRNKQFNRRTVLNGMTAGTIGTTILTSKSIAKSDTPAQDPLTAKEHKALRSEYGSFGKAKSTMLNLINPLLQDLEKLGYIEQDDSDILKAEGITEKPLNKIDLRTSMIHVVSMWNKKHQRGIVLLMTSIQRENYNIDITANPIEGVAGARVKEGDDTLYSKKTSEDDGFVIPMMCTWGCSIQNGTHCCWDCEETWYGDVKGHYKLNCTCWDDDGNVVTANCCEGIGYDCCYDCESDEKVEPGANCC
jgi:hypothetical protein